MEPKYIIDGESVDPDKEEVNERFPMSTCVRPTGDILSSLAGRGEYTVYRPDGTAIRTYTVRLNQKGNLTVETIKATGLEALSTLNLERLLKRFEGITKIWPVGVSSQVRKVEIEIINRQKRIDAAQGRLKTLEAHAASRAALIARQEAQS